MIEMLSVIKFSSQFFLIPNSTLFKSVVAKFQPEFTAELQKSAIYILKLFAYEMKPSLIINCFVDLGDHALYGSNITN